MRIAKLLVWIGLIAMSAVLFNGFMTGDFFSDGAELIANPWGLVSLVDLYVGFILFAIWIAYRERSIFITVVWIAALMIFGFLTGSIYVLYNLYKSRGSWEAFFLGSSRAGI